VAGLTLSIQGPAQRMKLITNIAAAMRCCSILSMSFNCVFLRMWQVKLLQNMKVASEKKYSDFVMK
jgi:hypothetical protein